MRSNRGASIRRFLGKCSGRIHRQALDLSFCLVPYHSRLDKLLYERDGKRLIERKANRSLCGFVPLKLLPLFFRQRAKKSDMVLERGKPSERPVVFIIRHAIADALARLGGNGFDYLAKLHKLSLYLFWNCRNVVIDIFCHRHFSHIVTIHTPASPLFVKMRLWSPNLSESKA